MSRCRPRRKKKANRAKVSSVREFRVFHDEYMGDDPFIVFGAHSLEEAAGLYAEEHRHQCGGEWPADPGDKIEVVVLEVGTRDRTSMLVCGESVWRWHARRIE